MVPVFMMKAQSELCASSSSRAHWFRARVRTGLPLLLKRFASSTIRSAATCRCGYTQSLVSLSQNSA
ncbi:hypothetical protein D3C86_973700 [compost metagenome]